MLNGNVLAASTGCASSCVSQFKSKRSKANERISVWCFLGSDAAIYWVPVPGGRGAFSVRVSRAVSGWRKKQIEECEMSLKQMQILDGAVAVKPEQEPVAWPCLIDSADFSENTITLVMQCDDYKVSAGTHWLSTTLPKEQNQ